MQASIPSSRVLTTGDFVIRYYSDEGEWRCWLIGVGPPYRNIIGRGKFPMTAMRDWNTKANIAKNELQRKAEARVTSKPKKKRFLWL